MAKILFITFNILLNNKFRDLNAEFKKYGINFLRGVQGQ